MCSALRNRLGLRWRSHRTVCAALLSCTLTAGVLPASAQEPTNGAREYSIGPQDVLLVTVHGRTELSGRYDVAADGTIAFPLIGRLTAAGLSEREVRETLQQELSDGYLKDPQLSVSVEQYRSQRVHVVGEVRQPGTYPVSGRMTVLDALTRAGFLTADAARTVLVVRAPPGDAGGRPADPAPPEEVDIDDLRSGRATSLLVGDGDTVLVPRGASVYVFGHVRTPGAYPYRPGLSVLEVLALAGGITDRGSDHRLRIVRTVDGRRREIKVRLQDLVQPGDTIKVPERFF